MWQQRINSAFVVIFVLAIAQQLPQTRASNLKCLQCVSDANGNCITDLSKVEPTECKDDTFKVCTTEVDTTGKVTRACAVDATKCATPNCQHCDGSDGCNKHNVCKTCDSATDPACSQTDGSKAAFNAICAAADTQCLTNVKANKHLERKCATADDIKACTNAETCSNCSGPNCNAAVFPTKRVRCYQCPSTDSKCGNVAANSDSIVSKPCLLYAADDKCYMFGSDATTMTRGCVSDADNKCTAQNEACATCTADNCNNSNYERAQKLKCVQCSSTKEDTACLGAQATTSLKDCQKQIVYNKPEQCYTQHKDDGTVARGCFYDRDAALGDCKTETGCVTCTSEDGCNSKDSTIVSCIICRSDLEPKCRKKATELKGSACRNVATADTAGCYYGIWNDVAIRGCLADGDLQQQTLCKDEKNKQCEVCKGTDCNTKELNGAASVTITTGLVAGILLVLWRLN